MANSTDRQLSRIRLGSQKKHTIARNKLFRLSTKSALRKVTDNPIQGPNVHYTQDPNTPAAADIGFDDFLKVDIRIGTIQSAQAFPRRASPPTS